MPNVRSVALQRVFVAVTCLLILKVTASVVLGYRNYFPPDFNSDFLQGREHYFFGSYRWAFYTHIVTGPFALIMGMILVSESFRRRFPKWHRTLGRIQIASVLVLVAPSGLWMAYYAAAGAVAGSGFAAMALATGMSAALGWKTATERRFSVHRRWMWRNLILLCSAVVLRLLGGLATVIGVQAIWFDPLAAWASWIVPLAAFELTGWRNTRRLLLPVQPVATAHSNENVAQRDFAPL